MSTTLHLDHLSDIPRTSGSNFGVTAVADSTGDCLARLRPEVFTNLTAGRLGVSARPGMRRASWLASDILTALGARGDVTGAGRPGDGDPLHAATWLTVHGVRDLYVQFAWDISHPALLAAIDLARTANVHLWLVGDSPYSDYHSDLLAPHTPREWTGAEFLDHWSHVLAPGPAAGSSPAREEEVPVIRDSDEVDADATCALDSSGCSPSTGSGWPLRLPDDDFTTFRAACRDRLSPSQFERVDAAFLADLDDARTSLVPMLAGRRPFEADTEEADAERDVADWFARRWEDTESLQHFQVFIRAAQVAAFGAGYFVQVNLDQLVGTAETTPRRAQRDADTWARLRAYPQPHRSAACALAAAGMALAPMTRLPINAYCAATGIVLCDNGDWFTVEPAARVFVEAQQTLRRLQGAEPHELLLVNPTDGRPIAPRTLAAAIRLVRREVGAAVALAQPDTITPDPSRWYRRWGISIQDLT